jgi:DNA gyrase subunit A
VRPIGRAGRGVTGIRFKGEDHVVGAEIVEPGKHLLAVTDNGMGKRTPIDDYPVQGRSGMGVITIRCNEKTGHLVGVEQVEDDDELLVVTSSGNIIRMQVSEISIMGRNTQGVRLVRMEEDTQIVGVEKLED